jgi:DNA recombination protein RmuC
MPVSVAIAVLVIAVGAMLFVWYEGRASRVALQRQLDAQAATSAQTLATLQQSLQAQLQAVDMRITSGVDGVQRSVNTSLSSAHETMRSVDTQLGQLSESTRQMLEVGRDISGLQAMLRAPKPRGQFGELLLGRLLADILPDEHFALQHRFRNGTIVDAAVLLGGGLVPVDSKFPDAAFRRIIDAGDDETARMAARRDFARDVRGHIDAVAKYILPDEGTFGFALMYIPAENVYYEAMVRDDAGDLQSYAQAKRVIPCSPNTFFAYLQALVLGLKGLRVEERSREIAGHLERLNGDFTRFRREFDTLGSHISHAKTKFDDLDRVATTFGDRLARPLEREWPELSTEEDAREALRLIP